MNTAEYSSRLSTKKSTPSHDVSPASLPISHLGSADQRSRKREADAGERERLVGAKKGADAAKQERGDQDQVNAGSQILDRLQRPSSPYPKYCGKRSDSTIPNPGHAEDRESRPLTNP